jgi:hypothetical protein
MNGQEFIATTSMRLGGRPPSICSSPIYSGEMAIPVYISDHRDIRM